MLQEKMLVSFQDENLEKLKNKRFTSQLAPLYGPPQPYTLFQAEASLKNVESYCVTENGRMLFQLIKDTKDKLFIQQRELPSFSILFEKELSTEGIRVQTFRISPNGDYIFFIQNDQKVTVFKTFDFFLGQDPIVTYTTSLNYFKDIRFLGNSYIGFIFECQEDEANNELLIKFKFDTPKTSQEIDINSWIEKVQRNLQKTQEAQEALISVEGPGYSLELQGLYLKDSKFTKFDNNFTTIQVSDQEGDLMVVQNSDITQKTVLSSYKFKAYHRNYFVTFPEDDPTDKSIHIHRIDDHKEPPILAYKVKSLVERSDIDNFEMIEINDSTATFIANCQSSTQTSYIFEVDLKQDSKDSGNDEHPYYSTPNEIENMKKIEGLKTIIDCQNMGKIEIPYRGSVCTLRNISPENIPTNFKNGVEKSQEEIIEHNSLYEESYQILIYQSTRNDNDLVLRVRRNGQPAYVFTQRKVEDYNQLELCMIIDNQLHTIMDFDHHLKSNLYYQDEQDYLEMIFLVKNELWLLSLRNPQQVTFEKIFTMNEIQSVQKIKIECMLSMEDLKSRVQDLLESRDIRGVVISERSRLYEIDFKEQTLFEIADENKYENLVISNNFFVHVKDQIYNLGSLSIYHEQQFGITIPANMRAFRIDSDFNTDLQLEDGIEIIEIIDNYIFILTEKSDSLIVYQLRGNKFQRIEVQHESLQKRPRVLKKMREFNYHHLRIYFEDSYLKINLTGDEEGNYNGLLDAVHVAPGSQLVKHDYKTGRYEFYSDLQDKKIGFIDTKFKNRDLLTINHDKTSSQQTVCQQVKYKSMDQYLKYYPDFGSFLHEMAQKPPVLEEFMKRLFIMHKDDTPVLFFKNASGLTPLDIAILKNQTRSTQILINLLVDFQHNPVFNFVIDKHLCPLIEKNFDLKEYFESTLPCVQINDDSFPSLHSNDETKIMHFNFDDPREILDNYTGLLEKEVGENDLNEPQHAVEYFLINMPDTMKQDPLRLMKTLSQCQKMEIFEALPIQTIINHKWNTYTKMFFQRQFRIYITFMMFFIADLFNSLYNKEIDENYNVVVDNRQLWITLPTKIISFLCIMFFGIYELRVYSLTKGHFEDPWNVLDFLLVVIFIPTTILEYNNTAQYFVTISYIFVVILSFQKINFFLRIYDGFSFLVSMMAGVIQDIGYFLAFFVIMLIQFGILFTILFQASDLEQYSGLGNFGYLMMSFRLSAGDFELDGYAEQKSNLIIFTWFIWIVAVFVLNLIFMNFIVAVISESYERVMTKLVAQAFKTKVDMIAEREMLMHSYATGDNWGFPKYLILRRVADSSEGGEEWQGFIKDIKGSIKQNSVKTTTELSMRLTQMKMALQQDIKEVTSNYDRKSLELIKQTEDIKIMLSQKLQLKQ
eukprot:403368936